MPHSRFRIKKQENLEESCRDALNDFTQTAVLDLAASSSSSSFSSAPLSYSPFFIGHCTDAGEAYEKRPPCQKMGSSSAEGEADLSSGLFACTAPFLPSLERNLSNDEIESRKNLCNYCGILRGFLRQFLLYRNFRVRQICIMKHRTRYESSERTLLSSKGAMARIRTYL